MKNILKILILLLTTSSIIGQEKNHNEEIIDIRGMQERYFVSDHNLYPVSSEGFTGKDTTVLIYSSTGEIKSRITYAVNRVDVLSTLRFGQSEIFGEEGDPMEIGEYQIGEYINCCAGGPCKQFYSYRIGEWIYYYPNGSIKAAVKYETENHQMDTSCEGGAKLKFGIINLNRSKFFERNGDKMNPTNEFLVKLQTVKYDMNEHQEKTLSLVNGKIVENIIMK